MRLAVDRRIAGFIPEEAAVGLHCARVAIVGEIGRQNIAPQAREETLILHREDELDAMIQVAPHHIGAA